MILIAGGNGRLGHALAPLLLERGESVRVLSRGVGTPSPSGCEAVTGDVRDRDSLGSAFADCTTVVSAVHGFAGGRGSGPDEVDHLGNANLIDAAREAGVRRFVLLSVLGASADHPASLFRAKHAAERHLAQSDLDWTIVRPAAYLETWIEVIGSKMASGGPALVFGRAENPINFVSVNDVAAVIDRCLTDPATSRTKIDVAGPENLSMNDFARTLNANKIKRIPRGALRVMQHAAAPVSPVFARQAATALVMDTADMTAAASPDDPRPTTRLRDLVG